MLDRGAQAIPRRAKSGDGVDLDRADAMVDAVSPVRLTESGDTSRLDSQRAIIDGSELDSGADAGGVNAVLTVECPTETGNDRRGQIRENVTNEAIYERGAVKRGGADFVSRAFPHIPFAVGFGRSGPSQTCPRTNWLCNPQHIL